MSECRPSWWIRLNAWLRGGKVVWLKDYQGQVLPSIAKTNAFGTLTCSVYWKYNVGHCVLLPDGTVDPNSEAPFVKYWKYADPITTKQEEGEDEIQADIGC